MKLADIQSSALNLPEDERASLAASLIGSLPAILSDSDDGTAEATRRLSEMREDPTARRTWSEIKAELGR